MCISCDTGRISQETGIAEERVEFFERKPVTSPMYWYRAEIVGEGIYFDSGVALPEEKIIGYEFQAGNDFEAIEKVNTFIQGRAIRESFWMFDDNPEIIIMRIICTINKQMPTQERAYLVP